MIAIKTTVALATALRRQIEPSFADDTSAVAWNRLVPSTGHCAIVAMLVRRIFGGTYVSAKPGGVSHWFNRLDFFGERFDVDLTGDQFGRPPVQVAVAGDLFTGTQDRLESHINGDTIRRFELFMSRIQ